MIVDGINFIHIFGYVICHNLNTGEWAFLKKKGKTYILSKIDSNGKKIYRNFRKPEEVAKCLKEVNNW